MPIVWLWTSKDFILIIANYQVDNVIKFMIIMYVDKRLYITSSSIITIASLQTIREYIEVNSNSH